MIQAEIDDDPIEPSIETRSPVKTLDIGEGAQKRVLREIFGGLRVTREVVSDVKRLFHITPHQYLEAIGLPLLTQGHQYFVAEILRAFHGC